MGNATYYFMKKFAGPDIKRHLLAMTTIVMILSDLIMTLLQTIRDVLEHDSTCMGDLIIAIMAKNGPLFSTCFLVIW